MILCKKGDSKRFHNIDCVSKTCAKCSDFPKGLKDFYNFSQEELRQQITYTTWEKFQVDAKTYRRCVAHTKFVADVLDEFVADVLDEFVENVLHPTTSVNMAQHLFTAHWQGYQYLQLKENLPGSALMSVIDFATNRKTIYDHEVKSVSFTPAQIILHPVVYYYQSDAGLVRHSVIVFSGDCTKDHHMVDKFVREADKVVAQYKTKVNVKFIFSDGCSSQYKSGGPLADLSLKQVSLTSTRIII